MLKSAASMGLAGAIVPDGARIGENVLVEASALGLFVATVTPQTAPAA
jgi:carbonic anhydrase/acetyltransferase-like protein (isoleucine patch superfamily)